MVFSVPLHTDLMRQRRHHRVAGNEGRRVAARADIYSLANSVVPNYPVASPSSLLSAGARFGNTDNCRAAARRYLKDKMSNPPHSNFSAMSLDASERGQEKTSGSSLFSEARGTAMTCISHHALPRIPSCRSLRPRRETMARFPRTTLRTGQR